MKDMKVFSGRANPDLAVEMCDYLGLPLGDFRTIKIDNAALTFLRREAGGSTAVASA